MDWLVTLPEWESKAPPSYRRRDERYWKSVELPLDSEFLFIVNTVEDRATRTPARSTALVTTAQLLDFLGRANAESIRSAYLMVKSEDEGRVSLSLQRLKAVRAGDAEQMGWSRIAAIETEEGTIVSDRDWEERVRRWANETEVFRFESP